jgi:predicted DNA-binding mobile mystery protein A
MQSKNCNLSDIKAILLEGLERRVPALIEARNHSPKPSRGWLRAVREAIGLTQATVAARMSVTRQSCAQFEVAEAKQSISLFSLRRAAEAMDCELVYFLVPRGGQDKTFADLARSLDPHAAHLVATEHSMSLGAKTKA